MSCTTGLHVVSSLRRSGRRIRPMRSRSMTMWIGACENGLQTPAIFSRHPKRELHEVHYARRVGIPSGLCDPSALDMYTRRTGGGLVATRLDPLQEVQEIGLKVRLIVHRCDAVDTGCAILAGEIVGLQHPFQ